jgi:hypothetical protein
MIAYLSTTRLPIAKRTDILILEICCRCACVCVCVWEGGGGGVEEERVMECRTVEQEEQRRRVEECG